MGKGWMAWIVVGSTGEPMGFFRNKASALDMAAHSGCTCPAHTDMRLVRVRCFGSPFGIDKARA